MIYIVFGRVLWLPRSVDREWISFILVFPAIFLAFVSLSLGRHKETFVRIQNSLTND